MVRAGTRSLKVLKLIGRVSGDIILFVSSKQRRLEARNFAVFFSCFPFTTYETPSFVELEVRSFTNGFLGPNGFRTFKGSPDFKRGALTTWPRCLHLASSGIRHRKITNPIPPNVRNKVEKRATPGLHSNQGCLHHLDNMNNF